jgi:excisionase family DNA binding protein
MGMNGQNPIASPQQSYGRSPAGHQMSHETTGNSQNESAVKTRLLTVEQVADLLHVPSSWVYGHTRRRAQDRIPGFRLGKYWRFIEADILQWVEKQKG